MRRNEPIAHIMSSNVLAVQVGQKISDVRRILAEHKIHHVPVIDGKRLVGVMSTTDLIRLSFGTYGADERSLDAILDHQFKLADVMQSSPITIDSKDTVRTAAQCLQKGTFHSLPVVNKDHELVGIVTTTDLIRYLLEQY